jgi:hypothetical protein
MLVKSGVEYAADHSPDANDLPLPDLMRDGGESLRKLGLLASGTWPARSSTSAER